MGSRTGNSGASIRAIRFCSAKDTPSRFDNVLVILRWATWASRSLAAASMNSLPWFVCAINAKSSSICASSCSSASFNTSGSPPANISFKQRISASLFATSKRVRISWIRSVMVSSFVALSTTFSGVVILPQSCSHEATNSSSRSFSLKLKLAKGPVFTWCAASVSISAMAGTRTQCPPVYGDFASNAEAISRIKD